MNDNGRFDKLLLTGLLFLFIAGIVALITPDMRHDAVVFMIGSATTVIGGLLGMMQGAKHNTQTNTIKDSTVNQPVTGDSDSKS